MGGVCRGLHRAGFHHRPGPGAAGPSRGSGFGWVPQGIPRGAACVVGRGFCPPAYCFSSVRKCKTCVILLNCHAGAGAGWAYSGACSHTWCLQNQELPLPGLLPSRPPVGQPHTPGWLPFAAEATAALLRTLLAFAFKSLLRTSAAAEAMVFPLIFLNDLKKSSGLVLPSEGNGQRGFWSV